MLIVMLVLGILVATAFTVSVVVRDGYGHRPPPPSRRDPFDPRNQRRP